MKIFILFIAFAVSINEQAQASDLEEEIKWLRAEAADLTVSSTTKSNMSIQKAPGVIRVFTAKDIKRYHFKTLQDILRNVPGMQINEYRAGHQTIWTRGVQNRYNNKTLLLIDGVPMRDNYYGNFNIDEILPLNQIQRIEVINGPGSVLYGANAFASVINITTKNKGRSVHASYGKYDSKTISVEGDASDFYAYIDRFETDGFSPELNSDGEKWTHPQDNQRSYALLKHQTDSFKTILSYTDYNYKERYRVAERDYTLIRKPIYLSSRYSEQFDNGNSLNIQGYINHYGFKKEKQKYKSLGVFDEYEEEYLDTFLYGIDADYSFSTNNHTVIAGLSYQQDQGDDIKQRNVSPELKDFKPNLIDGNISRESTSFFLQDIWRFNKSLTLVAGTRYDFLSDFDSEFNYRLGATYKFDGGLYSKLLYGTAFRVPSYREYLDKTAYNNSLKLEHLNTFELQMGYVFDKGDINLTFFHNAYQDFIGEINVKSITTGDSIRDIDDDEMAFNFDNKTISGLELYSLFQPMKKLNVILGASYIISAKEELGAGNIDSGVVTTFPLDTGEVEITPLSDYTLNLAASYNFSDSYSLGTNIFYVSARSKPSGYQQSVPASVRDDSNLEAYVLADIFAHFNVNKRFSMRFKVANVFDKKVYSPPFGGAEYDLEWRGREYNVDFSYKF